MSVQSRFSRTALFSVAVQRAIAAACLVALASCTWWEDTYIFSTEPTHKPTKLEPLVNTLSVKPLWNASVGKSGRYFFAPAMIGTDVVAAGSKGIVERRVLATGAVVWRTDLDTPLSAGVGSNGDTSVVATASGDVVALDSAGKPRWRVPTNTEVLSTPVVAQGLVIVRTSEGRIIAYEEETGRKKWTYTRSTQALMLRTNAGMVLDGSLLFAGFPGGRLVALNTANGLVRWESSVGVPKGATELERVADVVGTPIVTGREVCAGAFQGRVGCYDIGSGNSVWNRDLSTPNGVEIDGRFAYITDDKGYVNALTRTSGATVWKSDKLAYRRPTAPVSVGRAIVVGDYKGFVHWLSREDGSLIARSTTDGSALVVAPRTFSVGSAPAVLFQTPDGDLYAFVAE